MTIKLSSALAVFSACLVSTALGGGQVKVKVNPRTTFFHTNSDPAGDAVPIDLLSAGFAPGSYLRLTRLGDWDNGPDTDRYTSLVGVFSASATLLGSDQLHRVQDAIDASVDFHSRNTQHGNQPTDIPEDFPISWILSDHTYVTVPAGATHLFVTPHDQLFFDNSDPDADYFLELETVAPGSWIDLGFGLSGSSGTPSLVPTGTLFPGELLDLSVSNVRPFAPGVLFLGLSRIDVPFNGGVLVPSPNYFFLLPPASALGTVSVHGSLPHGVPDQLSLYFQFWFVDSSGPQGMSASNAVEGVTPGG